MMNGTISSKFDGKKIAFTYSIDPIENIEGNDAQVGADIELNVSIPNNNSKIGIIQVINPIVSVGDFANRRTDENWAVDKRIRDNYGDPYTAILYGLDQDDQPTVIDRGPHRGEYSAETGKTAVIRDIPREIFHLDQIEDGETKKCSFHNLVIYIKTERIEFIPAIFKWGYSVNADGEYQLIKPACEASVPSRIKKAIYKYYEVCGINYHELNIEGL